MAATARFSASALAAACGIALAGPADAASDTPGTAGAVPVTGAIEPARPPFYEPPATIPSTPGTVIRAESAGLSLDPLGLSSGLVSATRVMYSSRERTGKPIAVVGTVFIPKTPWVGVGPRPVITYAPGTQGMADRCAPSRQIAEGVEYEGPFFAALIKRGYAVAITDYQGLGTPGSHTYVDRLAQGRAVLDMARAAQRLGQGLSATSPVGISGYSQGGAAAASAAELAAGYAPDLRIRGTVAGAVPADFGALSKALDGGPYSLFLNSAVVGLSASYHLDLGSYLNPAGVQRMKEVEGTCLSDLASYAFQQSGSYTKDGRRLADQADTEPFKTIIREQRIGRGTTNAPVLVTHSVVDDAIPFAIGKQLVIDWCAKGVDVRLAPNAGVGHLGGYVPHVRDSLAFFEARFAGLPQQSSCGTL